SSRLSAIRSGTSLYSAPVGVDWPPSTATMPSNRLHSSRNWMPTAHTHAPHGGSHSSAAAPAAANRMLNTEIAFGVSGERASADSAVDAVVGSLSCVLVAASPVVPEVPLSGTVRMAPGSRAPITILPAGPAVEAVRPASMAGWRALRGRPRVAFGVGPLAYQS